MSQHVSSQHLDWTDGAASFLFEHCPDCGAKQYFRRGFCASCGSRAVASVESAGFGTVYAVTAVIRAPTPEWKALAPYGLALVDLDEGVRVMSHARAGLAIGDRVSFEFRPVGDRLIPHAVPHDSEKKTAP